MTEKKIKEEDLPKAVAKIIMDSCWIFLEKGESVDSLIINIQEKYTTIEATYKKHEYQIGKERIKHDKTKMKRTKNKIIITTTINVYE